MAPSNLRIVLPDATSEDEVAQIIADLLEGLDAVLMAKALRNPLPRAERSRAEAQFARLQHDFADWFVREARQADEIFGAMPEIVRKAPMVAGELNGLVDRYHLRFRARTSPVFKQFYARAMELGLRAGGAGRSLADNEQRLNDRVRSNEYAYLDNFLMDMRHREGTMDYTRRAVLYANALREAYWQGFTYADLSRDRYVRWDLGAAEHCGDCLVLAGDDALLFHYLGMMRSEVEEQTGYPMGGRWETGVYSAKELTQLAIFPQSGALHCTTNCKCRLEEVPRPQGTPVKPFPSAARFRSLEPKPFHGPRRGSIPARGRAARRADRTATLQHPRKGRAR